MSGEQSHAMLSWFEIVSHDGYEGLVNFLKDSNLEEKYATVGANAIFGSWMVCAFLIVLALIARGALNKAMAKDGAEKYHPEAGFSLRNIFEVYTVGIFDFASSSLGHKDTKKLFWLFGGMFLYILCSNLIGVLPGGIPPTQSMSNNFAMAAVVLVIFVGMGIMRQGIHYFTHMAGPVMALAVLIFPIELFGALVIRPFSLSVRLTGNLNGDHIVLGIASEMVPFVFPVIALCLGTFVSLIQSLVFTLLTIVYIQLSLPGEEDHH
jgi:F-type H+-transporting ATPase subunit a